MSFYTTVLSPLGQITLTASNIGLTGLFIKNPPPISNLAYNPKKFLLAEEQLAQYFAHQRQNFELELDLTGSLFQQQVWQKLLQIPFGHTQSYKQIALALNKPNYARAIGAANRKNPLCIIVPCHRVIGANGKLIGYNGGLEIKQWLLKHEKST